VPSLRKRAPSRSAALSPHDSRDSAAAERAAVTLLARRDHACGELAGKLRERGYDAEVIDALVADLRSRRLLDDERYAGHYVEYHRARGQGPVRIRRELGMVGVEAAIAEAALGAGADWAAQARSIRARRFGAKPPVSWREKARQARFLQYRGFSSDHIRLALGSDLDD
jgi:regulatory protein